MNMEVIKRHFAQERILYAMVGALIFLVVGWGVPDIYFKYFDKTNYVFVNQPVHVNQETFNRGDEIAVTLIRTSLIDTRGYVIVQLHLVNDNNSETKYPLADNEIAIAKSDHEVFYQKYLLPTHTPTGKLIPFGTYHLEAIISYDYRGLPKSYAWKSVSFSIAEKITE